jgi:hypothetical protein
MNPFERAESVRRKDTFDRRCPLCSNQFGIFNQAYASGHQSHSMQIIYSAWFIGDADSVWIIPDDLRAAYSLAQSLLPHIKTRVVLQ